MGQRRTLVRNIFSNYGALAVQMGVRFAQLALFVRVLGETGLGVITLFLAVPNISQIAGYSLSKGTIRYMSLSMAKGDRDASNAYFNSSLVAFTVLAIFAVAAVLTFYPLLDSEWLDVPPAFLPDAHASLAIIAAGLLITIPSNAAQGACQAAQRYDLVAAARTIALILQLALYLVAFWAGQLTLAFTFAVLFGTRVLEAVAWWVIARRAWPELAVGFRAMTPHTIKVVLLFSASACIIDLANILGYEGFKFILISKLDLSLLGVYGVFATLASALAMISGVPTTVLLPVAAKYDGLQDRGQLARLYYLSSKLTMAAILGMVLPILPFLPWVLSWGISPAVASHWGSCVILLLGQALSTGALAAGAMLAGVGQQRLHMRVVISWVSVATIGSLLVLWVGPGGLFWPIVVLSLAHGVGGVWLTELGRQVFAALSWTRFWWHVLCLPTLAGTAAMILGWTLHYAIEARIDHPAVRISVIGISILTYAIFCWFGVLTPDERQEFLALRRPKPVPPADKAAAST